MPASIVAILDVHDREGMGEYVARVPDSIVRAGGRIALRGHVSAVLEGDIHASRVVVIEFDTLDALYSWWRSSESQELQALRVSASTAWSFVVEEGSGGSPSPAA